MLNDLQLEDLFDRHGIPLTGRQLVARARKEAPVRKVQSNFGNVITHYCSLKMDRTIATESRSAEFYAAIRYEYDPDVLEYYPQPVELDMRPTRKKAGRSVRYRHFPDFMVIRTSGISLEEWKQEDRLAYLAQKHPARYTREDGGWRSPDCELHLNEFGIAYRLRSAADHPITFVNNLLFLGDYLDECYPAIDTRTLAEILKQFGNQQIVSLRELIRAAIVPNPMEGMEETDSAGPWRQIGPSTEPPLVLMQQPGFSTDDIYKAIADRQLYFDLYEDNINDPMRAAVYRNELVGA